MVSGPLAAYGRAEEYPPESWLGDATILARWLESRHLAGLFQAALTDLIQIELKGGLWSAFYFARR
jgi:hypothetical protein